MVDGKFVVHSLSGHERNRLFVNDAGKRFHDHSPLSGLDTEADSRGFVLWDYDRDGWQDIAVINANLPMLNLYHNDMSEVATSTPGVIAIRFVGGNHANAPSGEFSNRDGYGTRVEATLTNGTTLEREHRCGEGFASQNSATMLIGLGECQGVSQLRLHWPSGRTTTHADVLAGTLVTAEESGTFSLSPYLPATEPTEVEHLSEVDDLFPIEVPGADKAALRVYTTMATWCAACTRKLPQIQLLKDELAESGIEFIGIPVDEEDSTAMLTEYVRKNRPAYKLLAALPYRDRTAFKKMLEKALPHGAVPLPTTVIVDQARRVHHVAPGVPTLSEIRKLMASM